ncbi:MAG: GntR family transcriptional regulator [Streptosporangiales bacterium]|nr:GntR family transcriptional regulator [Streptosporangiales bacterium]
MAEPLTAGKPWTPRYQRRTSKTSHVIAASLRRQILSGELAVGQRLPSEAELTHVFEISRETLREALRVLESESLVEIRRGRGGGAVVRQPDLSSVGRYVALLLQVDHATLGHLEEARSVIEPPAAARAADRCGPADLDRLVALHDQERAAEADPFAFTAAVVSFDQVVTELAGNRSLGVIAGVLRHIHAGQVYAAAGAPDRAGASRAARRVIVAHSAVLEALRRRDGALAREAWSDYLSGGRGDGQRLIDVVPLWRAQASRADGKGAPRAAAEVATEIRSRIATGRLRDGDRLPSLADLAAEFGISRPTLREGLRILEMELLLDLRAGDRGGAIVRRPVPKVAAQLAGTVLQAREATLADFSRALRLFEPAMMELSAARIGPGSLSTLRTLEADLAAQVDDTPRFVQTWRRAATVAFVAGENPVLAVIAQTLQWVLAGAEAALTVGALSLPWVGTTNRNAHRLFAELIASFEARDAAKAAGVWDQFLTASAPFVESSDLAQRLIVDLME